MRIRYLDDYKMCEPPAAIEDRRAFATLEEANDYVRASMEEELGCYGEAIKEFWSNEEVIEFHNKHNAAMHFPGPRVAWETFEIQVT